LFIPAHADVAPRLAPSSVDENLSPFEREVLAGRMTLNIENRARHRDSIPATGRRVLAWRGRTISMALAAALVAIAGVEAGVIAWMAYSRPVAAPPAVTVQTSASGEHVLVPGASAGPGALGVAVAEDFGWVRVTSASSDGVLGVKALQRGPAALRISSPIELNVLEGARVLGSVPGRDLELSAGRHEIELVNERLGYRAQQVIEVEAGQVVAIHVSPPPGWVTIEAPGAPEVAIDGKAAGRAPLGPLALAPGEHQVTFTDQRGRIERQRITVKAGATTPVSAGAR
jgi:hypothetical protein